MPFAGSRAQHLAGSRDLEALGYSFARFNGFRASHNSISFKRAVNIGATRAGIKRQFLGPDEAMRLHGCIQLVNPSVAADVSRLKLANFVQFFTCSGENNDPAHIGCYEKRQAWFSLRFRRWLKFESGLDLVSFFHEFALAPSPFGDKLRA
jgi:hypothetical protein